MAAPACKAALQQASSLWPKRLRLSDGILPSRAHTTNNPTSDHELGNAFDLTHDPAHGVDCDVLADRVIFDPRVKYVIWNRRIYNAAVAPRWREYSGTNPHTKHMHVSIHASARDDTSPWWWKPPTNREVSMADHPELANIEGPLGLELLQDQNGRCTGYVFFSTTTGELHGYGPGWQYFGRSEDPTP